MQDRAATSEPTNGVPVPLTGPATPAVPKQQSTPHTPESAEPTASLTESGPESPPPFQSGAMPESAAGGPDSAAQQPVPIATGPELTRKQLLSRTRSFADQFRSEIAAACDEIMRRRTDVQIRHTAHQYKLDSATAIYDIAAEPNPQQTVLDMLVLVTLQWYAAEAHADQMFGEDARLIKSASLLLKDNAWALASRVMTDEQRAELLGVIDRWWNDNAGDAEIWYVRLSDFGGYGKGTMFEGAFGAVTGLPSKLLNTFVPINDAAASIDEAQVTAERITWLAPRLMILAQWRAESIIFETLATPEVDRLIGNTDRALDVAEHATQIAQTLPNEIGSTTESVLTDLADKHEPLRALLEESRATIESVDGLAGTSQEVIAQSERTIQAADQLTKSVDQMLETWQQIQATSAQAKAAEGPDAELTKPFDITEYTQALNAATATIEETNRVLLNLQSVTEPNILNDRLKVVTASGESFITHTSARLERLALIASAGVAAAGVLIVLAFKLVPARRAPA